MVLVVRNFNKYQSKNIRIEFPLHLREQMNWQMPTTELIYQVSKTTDKTCITFMKKKLHEDWGPIDQFDMFIEDVAFDGTPLPIFEKDYPELRAVKKVEQEVAV